MKRTTIWMSFCAACFLISLVSCEPRKAMALKETIAQKERVAYKILLDKNGPESKKLDLLVKEDYPGALALLNEEEQAFNGLISSLDSLSVDDIKQGSELKKAAIDYYAALKELYTYDRVQIAHQDSLSGLKGEALYAGQNKILELNKQKQLLFDKVFEKESALHKEQESFNTANNIK